MDTNKTLLTVDDIFRMEGRQKGWSPTDAELKAAQATVNDLNRNRLSPPQFMSLTNQEGRVIDVLMKPSGEPIVVEPKVQNTQQGIMTMLNPTNAVPVINPQTGQPLMGYAADPMMGGMPQPAPLAGGQMTATNAPTAAPVQAPAPSPTPASMQSLEGKKVMQGGVTFLITNGIPHVNVNGQWVPAQR